MSNKPHRIFRNPQDGVTKFKQLTRYSGNQKEEEIEEKDYTPKREDFIRSIQQYTKEKAYREENRNRELNVPANVELIEITFHDVFDSSVFENRYREYFGLSATRYTIFNTIGLFAVVSREKFGFFIEQLKLFIDAKDHFNPSYHPDIKFIQEFTFYSTAKIIQYRQFKPHVVIDLIDNVEIFQEKIRPIENSLIQYLKDKGIQYFQDLATNKVELLNATENDVNEIASNFDILQSINSYAAGFVRPNVFNLPDKSFGFKINNSSENLPIIGIIDTGISGETPLKDLIVNNDDKLNLTATSIYVDEANHGTAVAALAALGKKLYPNHIGDFAADAKLLSIKTLNGSGGYIVESEVIRLIKEAHQNYGVRIFTLTIGYNDNKRNNEGISEYAFALDKLTYELNILIFIAIGNNNNLSFWDGSKFKTATYPLHFQDENSNLCSPAESMNNITIGAAASNIEDNDELRISPVGSVPAIYTRTFHINWQHNSQTDKSGGTNWFRANKKFFKPDVCNFGGDYDERLDPTRTGLKILSTEPGLYFDRTVGTSFAAPLTANLAARIIRTYPDMANNMQTVKALIINSAISEEVGNAFESLEEILPNAILGHGIPDDQNCIYSSENSVTIILEDSILPESIKSYPIVIPKYLLDLNRSNALLKVKATLCFKFEPLKHHYLAYCPLHIGFGVFRNKALEEYGFDEKGETISLGINNNKTSNFVFSESWSQDYYFKAKMLSNSQRINFPISKKVLIEEDCVLKIAVNAKLHKLLNELDKSKLRTQSIPFSIVFTIEENTVKNTQSGKLYDELIAENNLEAINTADATLEAEG